MAKNNFFVDDLNLFATFCNHIPAEEIQYDMAMRHDHIPARNYDQQRHLESQLFVNKHICN